MIKGFTLSLAILSFTSAIFAQAQDAQAPVASVKQKPNHTVTFLPMGQAPPFKIKGRGEHRVLKAPPKDALPPKGLVIPSKKQDVPIELKLRQQSDYKIKLPKDRVVQLSAPSVAAEGEEETPQPWWRGKLPASRSSLVVLFLNPKVKNWSKPLSVKLKNDSVAFPKNSIRVLNVSPYPLIVMMNKFKRVEIKPGKHYIYKEVAREKKMAVYIKSKVGKPVKVYKANIDNKNTSRSNVVFYAAKPRRKGQAPVGVYLHTEKTSKSSNLSHVTP